MSERNEHDAYHRMKEQVDKRGRHNKGASLDLIAKANGRMTGDEIRRENYLNSGLGRFTSAQRRQLRIPNKVAMTGEEAMIARWKD